MSNSQLTKLIDSFSVQQIIQMFDLIPDMLFWVKDQNCHLVHGNQYFLEHIGAAAIADIIGRGDFDFAAPYLAKQFFMDDQKVMQGESVENHLEMNTVAGGEVAWFVTSKRPLLNEAGVIIGSYGISRHLEKTSIALSGMDALKAPVNYIRQHYKRPIALSELAQSAHLSISALERRFAKYLGKTPNQFINEVRLENARRLLLESNKLVASIAEETGFNDHSYFSRQFVKAFAQSPSQFRKEYLASLDKNYLA